MECNNCNIKCSKNSSDFDLIRHDFPILSTEVNGKPLIYLDNAATTQKPLKVIETLDEYYKSQNANIHRGVHHLSELATREFEFARRTIQKFLNARHSEEIIFTRGTTESINLVAATYGRQNVKEGDEILVTWMEHHSNIVPWQMLAQEKGAKLIPIPIDDNGDVILEEYKRLLSERTKIVGITHISNALGTVNPVKEMIHMAHKVGAKVLLDGAQSVQHIKVDLNCLDPDFFAFSGHKIYGPTGIGVLYGKKELLEKMPPYQGGGDMIRSVKFEKTLYNDLPYKFEAGTPDIAGAIGLGAAIDYVTNIGLDFIETREKELLQYAEEVLSEIKELRIIGRAKEKASLVSFIIDGIHPHDIGTLLDVDGIAIRTGHHCAQPVMERFKVPATNRASFAMYNNKSEIDELAAGIRRIIEMFN